MTMGSIDFQFRIQGVHLRMKARVIKGLIQPIILGWDFFKKYTAFFHPGKGTLEFLDGRSAPLLGSTETLSGCYYRVNEVGTT